jgi:hypothetical protein
MNITIEKIKAIKIESKEDLIKALDMAIDLGYELHKTIDKIGEDLYAQNMPKAA